MDARLTHRVSKLKSKVLYSFHIWCTYLLYALNDAEIPMPDSCHVRVHATNTILYTAVLYDRLCTSPTANASTKATKGIRNLLSKGKVVAGAVRATSSHASI